MTNNSDSDTIIPFTPPNPNVIILQTFHPRPSGLSPRNQRRNRPKIAKNNPSVSSTSSPKPPSRPKYSKKPDPAAPKITRPCTECGKQFWSWKALFGHMRCHPERQWRGINPPLNHHRPPVSPTKLHHPSDDWVTVMSEDDHDLASCLLMLASSAGPSGSSATDFVVSDTGCFSFRTQQENDSSSNSQPLNHPPDSAYRFECGGCKKVFGSHQALGGHRATHKHVNGCFAITRRSCDIHETTFREPVFDYAAAEEEKKTVTNHRCSICHRVFPSGQALGEHMRCHWEISEDEPEVAVGPNSSSFMATLDLNVPPTTQDGSSPSSSSGTSGLSLDLRLGL